MEKVLKEFEANKTEMDETERQGDESYNIQFMKLRELSQSLKSQVKFSTAEGEKTPNTIKNRYKDIVPFDYCRVKLAGGSDGDYINASFIKSPTQQRYIASQGPLPKTVVHFWQMVWENGVTTIVMACLESEGCPPKPKCQRYWSNSKEQDLVVGSFTIKLLEECIVPESEGSITKKRLLVSCGGEKRHITHLHHTLWPDKLIPTNVSSILHLVSTMRKTHPETHPNPILVHCSAGCGRTGTIIVIDYIRTLLQTGKIGADFNVHNIISDMRRQRPAIVQTQEQYHYVFMVVSKMFQVHLRQGGVALGEEKELHYATAGTDFCGVPCRPPVQSPQKSPFSQQESIEAVYICVPEPRKTPIAGKRSNPTFDTSKIIPTGKLFRGYDIGYPNRVEKPKGPRPMISSN